MLIVIAILLFLGARVYDGPIGKSQREAIRFQASTFSRMVNTLRAQGVMQSSKRVRLNNSVIYLNEYYWPANTNKKKSARSDNQTPEECQQIWNALYEMPPTSDLNISKKNTASSYLISSINGRVCRYELVRKQEGNYFFDYHLRTGKILTSYPGS